MSSGLDGSGSTMTKKFYLETLGCAKNRVDSEIMLTQLLDKGYELTEQAGEAEMIIVNTCGFLSTASQESINRILELSDFKEEGHCKKLVATGCLSQRYGHELRRKIPEIDGLLGSTEFERIPELLDSLYQPSGASAEFLAEKPHYLQYDRQQRVRSTPPHYAYLKIAEGCSNMCSFCNIPLLRGGFSSRSISSVVRECSEMIESGVHEINLISQDTSSYGRDLKDGTNLAGLLRAVSELEGDFWIRMFYCYPNSFTEEVLKIMESDPRFCRYLDMPFQHICDPVLKKMNRKITRKKIESLMHRVRTRLPDVAWRSTFIVGFPTEREEDFDELVQFVKEGHFQHVGVFLYSDEDNIRSSKYGDPVPHALKEERRERLMELQQEVSLKHNRAQIGTVQKVLVEGYSTDTDLLLEGRSQYQGPEVDGTVYINEGNAVSGSFHQVEITEAYEYDLIGKII